MIRNYLDEELIEKIINTRRDKMQELKGKKTNTKISKKTAKIMKFLIGYILETNENEIVVSKSTLTKILETGKNNTNRDVKIYFTGYGLGEYSYSNKYNITINGERKDIKRETHYYIYINKETLELISELMSDLDVDFNKLIEQIPESENKRKILGSKTETVINVKNYIEDEDYMIEHSIKVEKNTYTKEGYYSKITTILDTETNSIVHEKIKENEFIPKEKVIQEDEELEEESEPYFNNPITRENLMEKQEESEEICFEEDIDKQIRERSKQVRTNVIRKGITNKINSRLVGNKTDNITLQEEVVLETEEDKQDKPFEPELSTFEKMKKLSNKVQLKGTSSNTIIDEPEDDEDEIDEPKKRPKKQIKYGSSFGYARNQDI